MPVVYFIILGIPLLSLAWWFWAHRRLKRLAAPAGIKWTLGLMVAVLLAGYVWVLLGRANTVTMPIPAVLYALVLLWGLIFLPFLGLPTMLVWAVGSIYKRLFNRKSTPLPSPIAEEPWTRRQLLGTLAITLPVVATYGTGAFSLPRMTRFRIRELTVALPDLPAALDGLRIAHVTDTHVGKFTKGRVLDEIVKATNGLDADLVLFTGDLIDNTIRDLPLAVHMLRQLRAKSGVYVIEGNHDLFDDAPAFEKGVRDAGITLLLNQMAAIEIAGVPVDLLGIVWNHGEEEMAADVDTVSALRRPGAFPILLAHHPHAFDRAAENGIPLTLAGHTHGGQMMLTHELGAGPLMFRYWSGLYRKADRALVVGNGTGNWFPLRVNAPAEIIHLTLRKA
ncbi:metallophosphoesterase [Luteolibacter yonseiensis]|uniref:Metallophosphoesterase n=1 Tax=Luteolibacter yonseiensis TaxID=1144680 RepID=A0A934VC82_9BACT|nr:metallophosphoesterase [Luteolibacter yonseiensis]MBK1816696.1 metallophosphoesterase [Luteolibacter yonseiensis]